MNRRLECVIPGKKPMSKVRAGLHVEKVMLDVWWDCKGLTYRGLLSTNQTADRCVCLVQLHRADYSRESIRHTRLGNVVLC